MKNYLIKLFLLISLVVAQNSDNNSVILPGEKYNNQLKNSNKNGQGTYTFPNGDTYIGNFKNGSFHGQGTILRNDIKDVTSDGNRLGVALEFKEKLEISIDKS